MSNSDNKVNVGSLIESTLHDLIGLARRLVTTLFDFTFRPNVFQKSSSLISKPKSDEPRRYARPFTYLTISAFSALVVFYSILYNTISSRGQLDNIMQWFIEAAQSMSVSRLLVVLLPILIIVSIFSSIVKLLSSLLRLKINYIQNIPDATAYFFGTVFFWLSLCLPLFSFFDFGNTSLLLWVIMLFSLFAWWTKTRLIQPKSYFAFTLVWGLSALFSIMLLIGFFFWFSQFIPTSNEIEKVAPPPTVDNQNVSTPQ